MPCIEIIQDCQYGSTGKGLFAGYLAASHNPEVLAMAPSPNAGHTLVLPDGRKYIHRMLPLGFRSKKLHTIVLGPGSILDLDVLQQEIIYADLQHVRICVHRNAAVVLDRHRDAEAHGGTAPGSTRKGVGAAQANRILRNPDLLNTIGQLQSSHHVLDLIELVDTAELQRIYLEAESVQIEGCQGYSLSIYHGQYPFVTCRDVTVYSLLADCGMPVRSGHTLRVYGVFRTYPIRVANRPESGEWSGPTYPDSKETTFRAIGKPQELTTVTNLPRRIFTYSQQQAIEACIQNRVDAAFLNFCNYPPTFEDLQDIWLRLSECTNVQYVGFGPRVTDVYQLGAPGIATDHFRHLYEHYHRTSN